MTKKVAPLLLATSLLVAGFMGGFINAQPASAITSVDELSDVSSKNWAYDSLKNLVEKYNVIEGYPDRTFRGNRAPTRYELAAALDALIKAIDNGYASKADLATVAKLQDEFAVELNALQARTDALEARAVKIEAKNAEQDNRLAVLEKLKFYGDFAFGGYSDISGNPNSAYSDSLGLFGRTRLNFDYNVVEDKGGAVVGPGTVHSTLVGAFGSGLPRNSGAGSVANNRLSNVNSIATDSSIYNTSFLNGTSDVQMNAYIQSAYYSQVLRIPVTDNQDWKTSATIHAGLIPWRDIFFRSPYQGNDLDQFNNTAFLNNAAVFQDSVLPRIAGVVSQNLGKYANFKLKGDMSSVNVTNSSPTIAATAVGNRNAVDGIGFTFEGDLGYNLGFLDNLIGTQDLFNHNGNIFGGYYFVKSDGTLARDLNTSTTAAGITTTSDTANGYYVGINQELYKGLGIFANFAVNDTGYLSSLLSALQVSRGTNGLANLAAGNFNGIKEAFTIGSEIPVKAIPNLITFGKRQNDALGIAFAVLKPNTGIYSGGSLVDAASNEHIFETYYRLKLNDNFALIPNIQLVGSRAGSKPNEMDVVLGLRSTFTF